MLTILFRRRRLLNSYTLNLTLFTPNFENKSPIKYFSSIDLLSSSESEPKRGKKSEQVISLFRSYGFSETHISKILHVRPQLLSADPHKIIAPKIEFLRSIGISNTDLPKIVSANPGFLTGSLQNQLIPCHSYLKSVLIHDDDVVKMLRKSWSILVRNVERVIAPNISLLTEMGVPKSQIRSMLLNFPNAAFQNHNKLKKIIDEVISMGFDPIKCTFVLAIDVLCKMKKTTLDRKWAAFRSWGLSDDDILMTFRRQPLCMTLSEEKIMRGIDFLVNKMGWQVEKITMSPVVLCYSLENRITPRCRVVQVLISAGILNKDLGLGCFLNPSDTKFMERFVSKYEDKVPGLLDIYRGTKGAMQTVIGSDNLSKTK